jgi:hypothetical protein
MIVLEFFLWRSLAAWLGPAADYDWALQTLERWGMLETLEMLGSLGSGDF